jgi:hypothetical protein
MDSEATHETAGPPADSVAGERPDAAAVNVAALAERVLRLMRDEVRLARARGAVMFERGR